MNYPAASGEVLNRKINVQNKNLIDLEIAK